MNKLQTRWEVQIQGGAADLEYLSRYFTAGPICVLKDAESSTHVLYCDDFENCGSSESVLSVADEQLVLISGILRFARDSFQPLRSGAAYRRHADGRREVFVRLTGVQVRAEVGILIASVSNADGTAVAPPPPPPERAVVIATLARTNSSVAKAMRLLAADHKNWVALYRIHEVIEADVGGKQALKKCGWGTAKQLDRFKHSANSVSVAGDASRHGKEVGTPPSNPMSVEEAAAYVNYILHAWLSAKGA